MTTDHLGMPTLPPKIPTAAETFNSLKFEDLWAEAGMQSVCHYLRSSVHLRVPEEFAGLLPRKL